MKKFKKGVVIRRPLTGKKLKKKALDAMSRFIRLKYANAEGFVKCVTCTVIKHWKHMQAGHFINGRKNAILFEEINVHPQCYVCNVILKGNWSEYYGFMEKTYGLAEIHGLLAKKKEIVKFYDSDYRDLIKKYQVPGEM